jgi:hypothetical protein
MTRQEQLRQCKKCLNRKYDLNKGVICSLTGDVATFQDKCPDFNLDKYVKEHIYAESPTAVNKIKYKLDTDIYEKFREKQNMKRGVVFGFAAMLLCSLLWAEISISLRLQSSLMAIGIGTLVGFSVRYFGYGVDNVFGVVGALLSFVGILFGNVLIYFKLAKKLFGWSIQETLIYFDSDVFYEFIGNFLGFSDIIFYGLTIYIGFRASFRKISKKDIQKAEVLS